jgi:hypothetical protein
MAASWTVEVLASMDGGRGGGGGRTVAVVLPFLCHGEEVKWLLVIFERFVLWKVLFQILAVGKSESD